MSTKSYKVSRGYDYNYIHVAPDSHQSPIYVLLLHGFPSLAHEWHHQIDYFSTRGYGVIAPDLLGYGATSRPENVDAYAFKKMSQDVIEVLDHEGVDKVIGVGHDWGSGLMSRLAVYYPQRFTKVVFMVVGYMAFGQKIDVDLVNEMTKQQLGYSIFGYMKWFNEQGAAEALAEHPASLLSLLHTADPTEWVQHVGPVGALEKWVRSGSMTAMDDYFSEEDQNVHNKNFGREGGYIGPLNWYKAFLRNINYPDEKDLTDDDLKLKMPVLLLTAAKEVIAIPVVQVQTTQSFCTDLSIKELHAAHWMQLEVPEEANIALEEFFEAK